MASTTKVFIREANLDDSQDASDVLRLTNHYAQHPMGGSAPLPDDVQASLVQGLKDHPMSLIFLAYVDGKAIGIATCFVGFSTFAAKRLINVHDLAVHADYQGQGIGGQLLEHVKRVGRERGYASVTLEVRMDNIPGRRLYSRLGFQHVGGEPSSQTMLFGKVYLDDPSPADQSSEASPDS